MKKRYYALFISIGFTLALSLVLTQVTGGTADIQGTVSFGKYGPLNDGTWLRFSNVTYPDNGDQVFFQLHEDTKEDLDEGGKLVVVDAQLQNLTERELRFVQDGALIKNGERIARLDYCGFIMNKNYLIKPEETAALVYCAVIDPNENIADLQALFNKDAVVSGEKIFDLE